MFYITTHSVYFIYGHIMPDIGRKEFFYFVFNDWYTVTLDCSLFKVQARCRGHTLQLSGLKVTSCC